MQQQQTFRSVLRRDELIFHSNASDESLKYLMNNESAIDKVMELLVSLMYCLEVDVDPFHEKDETDSDELEMKLINVKSSSDRYVSVV